MTSGGRLVVLDSTVSSFLMHDRGQADYYRRAIAGLTPVLPFQAVEEAWFGAIRDNWGDRRTAELQSHIERFEIIWPNAEMVRISAACAVSGRGPGADSPPPTPGSRQRR